LPEPPAFRVTSSSASGKHRTVALSLQGENKKPPARITIAVESKILASREEAAQMLSISQRARDYLIATRRLPTRRIGGRILVPVSELRKYARTDHPERIVA
jgi:chaperone required for assembly of F1-ATPase